MTRFESCVCRILSLFRLLPCIVVFAHLAIAIVIVLHSLSRNYDILAAVFTDVLQFMHEDLNIV
jgi:hypothetical protein